MKKSVARIASIVSFVLMSECWAKGDKIRAADFRIYGVSNFSLSQIKLKSI